MVLHFSHSYKYWQAPFGIVSSFLCPQLGQVIVDCNMTSILFFIEEGLVFRAEDMFSAVQSIMPEKKNDRICLLSNK
jgi:hypothetical protein